MADEGEVGGVRRRGEREVRFSHEVAQRICKRIASGETMRAICADADMPHRSTVRLWAKEMPKFGEDLTRARAASGWVSPQGGRPPSYCEVTAQEIFARLCEGETLSSICADPAMPSMGVVWNWRKRYPAFAEAVLLARQIQGERLSDQGWEIAQAVTPGDAYATHVKLLQLRWMAGCLAPQRFGRLKPLEAVVVEETAPEEHVIAYRHFKVEERRADGACRVVAFRPDPETGRLVRETPEDAPWERVPPALAARWRSPADNARVGGVVGVNAPPPLRDGDDDPDAEAWGREPRG